MKYLWILALGLLAACGGVPAPTAETELFTAATVTLTPTSYRTTARRRRRAERKQSQTQRPVRKSKHLDEIRRVSNTRQELRRLPELHAACGR